MKFQLDPRKFYFIGMILFMIGTIGNLWSLYIVWELQNIGGKISSVSSLLFQILLTLFFYYLWKTTPKPIPIDQQQEINKLIEQYSS